MNLFTNLLLFQSLFHLFLITEAINIKLEFKIDDDLKRIEHNSLILNGPYTKSRDYQEEFEGFLGENFIFSLDNKAESGYLAAIITIGTTKFSTGDTHLWSSQPQLSTYSTRIVFSKSVKSIETPSSPANYKITFTPPLKQMYCSNELLDKSKPVFYAYLDKKAPIKLNDLIFGNPHHQFEVPSAPVYGKIEVGSVDININTKYDLTNIEFIGTQYKTEMIKYKATSSDVDAINSGVCEFKVIICYSTCKTCLEGITPDDSNHECSTCLDTSAKMETKPNDNCYWIDQPHPGFYYSPRPDHYIRKCPESCSTCSFKPIDNRVTCDTCNHIGKYHPVDGTTQPCLNENPFLNNNQNYLLDSTGPIQVYKKCYEGCKKCTIIGLSTNHECDECMSNYSFYEGKGDKNCYDNRKPGSNDGYYYAPGGNKYYKCHPYCKTCSHPPITIDTKCNICQEGYWAPNSSTPLNCIEKCKDYWITDQFGQIKCVNECNDDKLLVIPGSKECVSACPPSQLIYINTCVSNCPLHTHEYNGKCLDSCFPVQSSAILTVSHTIQECLSSINMYIIDYLELNEDYIIGNDFILQVYKTDSPKSNIQGITQMDFIQCENELRSVYDIPPGDPVVIAKVDIFNPGSSINQTEYNVYNKKGKLLDLAKCSKINTSIYYPITEVGDLNFTLSQELLIDTDIDVFHSSSSFYNDICFPFIYNDKDMTLNDRRDIIYPKAPICEGNCIYNLFDYSTNVSHCICSTKTSFTPYLRSNTYSASFSPIQWTNLIIGKCTIIFTLKELLLKNIGFWLNVCLSCLQLLLFCGYIFQGGLKVIYPRLYNFHIQYINAIKRISPQISYLVNINNIKEKVFIKSNEILSVKGHLGSNSIPFKRNRLSINGIEALSSDKGKVNQKEDTVYSMWLSLFFSKQIIIRAFRRNSPFDLFTVNTSLAIVNIALLFTQYSIHK